MTVRAGLPAAKAASAVCRSSGHAYEPGRGRAAATAKACAEAGVYLDLHPDPTFGESARLPRRQIDSTTVVIDEHTAGRAGDSFNDDTGQYDVFFANGRVFAQGRASNVPHMKIVRDDLERLAAEIAG
jgi:hypothetical protein